ncbi:DNA mismatch repair endonuclease MutL [Salipaludibacillus aurantiacus]|uniref:DNA mismatch repair protein MutL n=1 Tax=Salipaludibacillus aurantiacus TaxID=1601833 RepID=A0A1H9QF37_9BACI|nr:DNA mismatch repair endonuclease MutL [Salipaludibacillus aurantiacus]SER59010.1 DNA mismatch repair protein MutL [Salipaludibacillus aurantiacus]
MAKIFQLNEHLSNKIAAGEVVERPASVVKELVENAIDANSTTIRVDVEEGGLASIRVLDDGDGIEEDDLETAFDRHATSKIKYDQDLFRIKTLGFRGEALPSIASVSKLTLKTSSGNHEGHELYVEGGHIKERKSASPRKGTEIRITDLFYNTPARLKYLKTIHTELGHISDVMNRMALSHPEKSFILTHNRKTVLQTAGNGDLTRVIASIYGTSVARKIIKTESESLDFKITGYIAKPEVTRSNRSYMSTIINGRFVKNYALVRAIQEGYHTLLPIGKFPLVVLHIEMNPLLVDVNVHPSKLEVRISKEGKLQELVTAMIKDAFKQVRLIPEVSEKITVKREKPEQMVFNFQHEAAPSEEKQSARTEEPSGKVYKERPVDSNETSSVRESVPEVEEQARDEADNSLKAGLAPLTDEKKIEEEADQPLTGGQQEPEENLSDGQSGRVPVLYPIGQLHGTYILAQNEQGLYMIDQHAAQERIKYEYFRDKLASEDRRLQDLIVPITFDFTAQEASLVTEHKKTLEQAGLFLEAFGSNTYMVRSCPVWFPEGHEEETISEILEQLKNERTINIGKIREEAAILMSCKAAIKANRHLTTDEMFQLLETLRTCEDPFTCPHGRPILVHYSTYDIERMFKRVMS